MRVLLLVMLTSFFHQLGLLGQSTSSECISFDFETIQGETPTQGQTISTEFLESTGISFILEDGTFPIIAQAGLPTEAFAGNFGPDTVDPAFGLGNFFITDDGILDGVDVSPFIVSFEDPVDSLSGFILDIDSDETFVIQVMDFGGSILEEMTLDISHPLAGDAMATPFGFNMEGCEGSIYSLKIIGTRSFGDFGLGMDQMTFCFTGIDLLQDLEVVTTDILCQDNPGTITITNTGDQVLTYSIDEGVSFQEAGFFDGLSVGMYEILVRNENGCEAILNAEILAIGPTIIESVNITHTSCNENNGALEVFATQDQGVTYYIELFDFQTVNTFDNLEPGDYTITVIGPTGCSSALDITINDSELLLYDGLELQDDGCELSVGQIEIINPTGTGQIMYSIDGFTFQEESVFDSLTANTYEIYIEDESGCTEMDTATIGSTPKIEFVNASTVPTLCDLAIAEINVEAIGGTGSLRYQIDGASTSSEGYYTGLIEGDYTISVLDDLNCQLDTTLTIPVPKCPIFIPNVFTPESNDFNQSFRIFTHPRQAVTILSYDIFDRWGSLLYSRSNFSIFEEGIWWTGTKGGKEYSNGVYVYAIKVEYEDGEVEYFTGDITLVR